MTSDLSSALEVCFKRDALNITLLYLTGRATKRWCKKFEPRGVHVWKLKEEKTCEEYQSMVKDKVAEQSGNITIIIIRMRSRQWTVALSMPHDRHKECAIDLNDLTMKIKFFE